jgi:hypothetical protein
MKRLVMRLGVPAMLTAFAAVPAQAELTSASVNCAASTLAPGPNDCSGAWRGDNRDPALFADIVTEVRSSFGYLVNPANAITLTAELYPSGGPGGSVGFINIPASVRNIPPGSQPNSQHVQFVIVLAAAESFSLYKYDFLAPPFFSFVNYNTTGVALNIDGSPVGLSHADLLVAIPEPASLALMLVGLGGVGLLARRRYPGAHCVPRAAEAPCLWTWESTSLDTVSVRREGERAKVWEVQ